MSPRKYDMSRRAEATAQTRRRIVEATMALHDEQGIAATSWEDIAQRAGCAPGTVYRHFPSLDELLPACGEPSLARLALPAPDRAPALFAAASPAERARILVTELYAAYERGAAIIETVRREADLHPVLAEARRRLEASTDALVAAAGLSDDPVARALVDVGTWRALEGQGVRGGDAVATVAGLLACRLED
jgi:AcrR family transcriptional regulator